MRAGDRLGAYLVERELGRGGMAETFVARRTFEDGSSRRVCLKRVLPAFATDAELIRAFEQEARLAAELRHANIVLALDHGVLEGSAFLAMELVEGGDLRQLIRFARRRGERMPDAVVARIAFDLGHALDFAHAVDRDGTALGLVHRDISPSNVLVGMHGEVKLADFGIAKALGASHHTKTGILKGKIPYMSPEYVRGGPFGVSSDLFALGVTLFECLAPRRPYDGATEAETLHNLMHGHRVSLHELAEGADPRLVAAVEALVHPDVDARPETARAFVDMLAECAPGTAARLDLASAVRALQAAREAAKPVKTAHYEVEAGPDGPEAARTEPVAEPAAPDAATRTRRP